MLVFSNQDRVCCYVHLPKCSGKFIRGVIKENYTVIKEFWGDDQEGNNVYDVNLFVDRAHIPIGKFFKQYYSSYIDEFIVYTRNPYDRLISAYFYNYRLWGTAPAIYKRPIEKQVEMFQEFVKHNLVNSNFDKFEYPLNNRLDGGGVHFAKQWFFIQDGFKKSDYNITINKLENIDSNETMWKKFKLPVYDLELYYDDETLEIVNDLYSEDFTNLGYEKTID